NSIQSVQFQVLDIDNQIVQEQIVQLERQLNQSNTKPDSSLNTNQPHLVHIQPQTSSRSKRSQNRTERNEVSFGNSSQMASCAASWQFTPASVGFYRVQASLNQQCMRSFNLAVLDAVESQPSPFGWAITSHSGFQTKKLPALTKQLSLGWVKLPVWIEHSNTQAVSEINQLMGQLKKQGVHCVGVLDHPPSGISEILNDRVNPSNAASLFSDSQVWLQSIEPLLLQINFGLEWLQLGNESDLLFVNDTFYTQQVANMLRQIQSLGQDVKLVAGWDWLEPDRATNTNNPETENESPWWALHYSASPALTPAELLIYAKQRQNLPIKTWTSIEPLPADSYSSQTRTQDLAQQMIAVGQARIQAAFATKITDDQHGLLDRDANCSELLVPWVILSRAVGSKQYLGALDLPNQRDNHLFEQDGQGVMIAWSQQPVVEEVYLGSGPRAIDVWGREVPIETVQLPSGSQLQRLPIGPWPVILFDVEPEIVRIKREFELLTTQLTSEVSERGKLQFRMLNAFGSDLNGSIAIHSPYLIKNQVASQELQLSAMRTDTIEIPFDFRHDASAGIHALEFAFHLRGKSDKRFSLFRQVRLGHPELQLDSQIDPVNDAVMKIEVELLNSSAQSVSFDCKLFPRGHAYQTFQILDAPVGKSIHSRQLQIPRAAVTTENPLWVRCEQIGTGLVLNYRVSQK
ncbi:MAG TPA: hypothetical protein DCF63_00110, partial [Planctomycetaceae bacterium]|nr:hypothetical protein [Planctomycetaceae bacterium]